MDQAGRDHGPDRLAIPARKLHNDVRHRYLERRAVNDPAALFAHALSEVRAALNLTDYLDTTFKYGVMPRTSICVVGGAVRHRGADPSTAQAAATA
jgi:hypothetical protein